MPSYLQIENISKSYGTKTLFDRIGFNINEGDKIALIAPNGAGFSPEKTNPTPEAGLHSSRT